MSTTLWTPSSNSGISMLEFMHFVEQKHNLNFGGDYHKFYTWSIEQLNQFWLDFFFHACVRHSVPPTQAIDTTAKMSSIPKWFPDCRLNYAENILSGGKPPDVALLAFCEGRDHVIQLTFGELQRQVTLCARSLQHIGVKPGDRVAGLFPNCIEAVICYLATSFIGAIWSSAPPDFGVKGIVQRFSMVRPTVLFAVTRTVYRGKTFDQTPKVIELVHALEPQLKHVILVPFLELFDVVTNNVNVDQDPTCPDAVSSFHLISDECFLQMRADADARLSEYLTSIPHSCTLQQFLKLGQVGDSDNSEIGPVQLPFSHPMVIMFSSGTTGPPKCIVHSGGGTLIKHMCEQKLHSDIRPADRLLYLTNVGWMMWNWLVSVLALGCSAVLYEGCPFDSRLWAMIDSLGVTALGTSAKWLAVLEDRGLKPGQTYALKQLRTIFSTGSPLAPRSFDFVYRDVKSDLMLGSISGGTDMIGCCVGCCPILPIHRGQIQCRFLGMAVESWDEDGQPHWDQKGELIIAKPFPSMPVGFWRDDSGSRYQAAYFARFGDVWAHGDFIELHSDTLGLTISGRSDATLNPSGIRFGSAEIYNLIESLPAISDSLCVAQSNQSRTDERVLLFVKPADIAGGDTALPKELEDQIRNVIRSQLSPRFLPAIIQSVPEIPYTVNGKKVELAVRRLLEGQSPQKAFAKESLADPTIVDLYAHIAELIGQFD